MTKSLLLALLASALLSASTSAAVHEVPLFSLRELSTARNPRLEQVLTTTGLLAVPLSLPQSSSVRAAALGGLCRCVASSQFPKLQGADQVTLGDRQTVRQSLATATVGDSPLPLGEDLASTCGLETAQAMEALRDQVADLSLVFLQALDQLVGNPTVPILQNSYGGNYHSVSSIVQAASNLEHFHVYSKPETDPQLQFGDTQPDLQVHTDAGLFLAFVPAFTCHGGEDNSFFLRDAQGNLQQTVFPPNSVAIMLGAGAEHWLKTTVQLKATRHAVQMQPGSKRAWYGMMHLVPESAIVEESPRKRTFGEMRQAMILKSQSKTTRRFGDDPLNEQTEDISIGCGFSNLEEPTAKDDTMAAIPSRRRRRLQHVENAGACNNQTNFYCWMSCLDIPSHQEAEGYINEGYSLYCVDPTILASTGKVSDAQEPCIEQGVVGLAMNSNCMGMWQPTAPGVVAQEVAVEKLLADQLEERFCYGGTSMYMDGFQWLGTTCPIYLFPSLVLDSAGALVGACFFTILFGMALEWVIQQRRITVKNYPPGYQRLLVSATFYGIQLTMGYTIMLVVMIYSIPLFLSVVIGIVGGHVLFSASDAIFKRNSAAAANVSCETSHDKWSDDPEEVGPEDGVEKCSQSSGGILQVPAINSTACSRRPKKEFPSLANADPEIPEGSTPCCQNAL